MAGDLQRIDERDRFGGLSQGSGLESLRDLQELDAMIANNDMALDIGEDSMEAVAAAGVAPDAAERNAMRAHNLLGRGALADQEAALGLIDLQVVVLKFSRSPDAFRKALLEGPELRECREALEQAGHPVVLDRGAKIFVRPAHYRAVMAKVWQSCTHLHASHVVVSEEFEENVKAALSALPGSARVVERARNEISASWDVLSQRISVRVVQTFVTVRVPAPLLSAPPHRAAHSA